MSWAAKGFVGWFGPRGLNSLLLVLLAVHAGVPGAEVLLGTVGVVVVASVVLHGASAGPVTGLYARKVARETLEEEREASAADLLSGGHERVPELSPEDVHVRLGEDPPPILLDVRSRSSYDASDVQIPGSIRVLPDEVAQWAGSHPPDRLIIAYCA